jgi:hypothetical protein
LRRIKGIFKIIYRITVECEGELKYEVYNTKLEQKVSEEESYSIVMEWLSVTSTNRVLREVKLKWIPPPFNVCRMEKVMMDVWDIVRYGYEGTLPSPFKVKWSAMWGKIFLSGLKGKGFEVRVYNRSFIVVTMNGDKQLYFSVEPACGTLDSKCHTIEKDGKQVEMTKRDYGECLEMLEHLLMLKKERVVVN